MSWPGVSWSLEFSVVEEGAPRPSRNHRRKIVLYVHLSADALVGTPGVARVEHGNHLITTGQAQDWCNVADQVVVQPVLDPRHHRSWPTRLPDSTDPVEIPAAHPALTVTSPP